MTMHENTFPSPEDWLIDQLRFTVFPTEERQSKPASFSAWWEKLTDTNDRDINYYSQQKIFVERGSFTSSTFPGVQLQILWEPGKCEFRLLADSFKKNKPNELHNIGKLAPRIAELAKVIEDWSKINDCPEATRIALGVILLRPVLSKEEGYKILAPFLKDYVKIDLDSSDFRYHINRTRQSSKRSEVTINRLMHWFVWVWQQTNIELDTTSQLLKQNFLGAPQFAVRAELDINTMPDENIYFAPTEYSTMWAELAQLATEISMKGDHK